MSGAKLCELLGELGFEGHLKLKMIILRKSPMRGSFVGSFGLLVVYSLIFSQEVGLLLVFLFWVNRKLTDRKVKDEKHQAITVLPPESAVVCNSNATNVKESYELLVKKKSAVEEQLHTMSKVLKELEEEMKVLSSKREVEANRKPPIITYSKSRKAKVMDVTDRTSTEDLPEETSEETSDDDEDDFERDGQVTKMLRPIRLRACRVSKMTKSHAVKSAREAVVDVSPPSASPHSTTTS